MHATIQQDEIFSKAKRAKVDMAALGERIAMRKQELKAEMGMVEDDAQAMEMQRPPAKKGRSGRPVHAGRS